METGVAGAIACIPAGASRHNDPRFMHQQGPSSMALRALGFGDLSRETGDAPHSFPVSLPPVPAVFCVFGVGF